MSDALVKNFDLHAARCAFVLCIAAVLSTMLVGKVGAQFLTAGQITGPPGLLDGLVDSEGFDQEIVPPTRANNTATVDVTGSRQLEHVCDLDKDPQGVRVLARKGPGFPDDFATCVQFVRGPCAVGHAVCSTDSEVELECNIMGFTIENGQLVHRSTALAYTTPADSTAFGLAHVLRPIMCEADILRQTDDEEIVTGDGTMLNTTRILAEIPVGVTLWCHIPGSSDTHFETEATCRDTLPPNANFGWRLTPLVTGYTAVPQQCTIAAGTALIHTVTDGCAMPGMADIDFTEDETWIAQKAAAPATAYAMLHDDNPATDATLSVQAWCTFAVVPDKDAPSYMCGGSGRRLNDKEHDEINPTSSGASKYRILQEESCDLQDCDIQTVQAQIEISIFPDGFDGGSELEPVPELVPHFDLEAHASYGNAGWLAFGLLIAVLFGAYLGNKKTKHKAKKQAGANENENKNGNEGP